MGKPIPASPPPVHIFVRFEIWNPLSTNASQYDPVDAGTQIDLMDHDWPSGDDLLDSRPADANGAVLFSATDYPARSGDSKPDLYFVARIKGKTLVKRYHPTDDWSTKGWTDTKGRPGYYPSWDGRDLGTLVDPLVFRIGVDFHLKLTYTRKWPKTSAPLAEIECNAPPGVPVLAMSKTGLGNIPLIGPLGQSSHGWRRTNKKGEVHGIIFDISPGEKVWFVVKFEVADPSINLKPALVHARFRPDDPRAHAWRTSTDSDADLIAPIAVPPSSIGSPAAPFRLHTTVGDKNVALFLLSIMYELSAFLFHITNGSWKGFSDTITYFMSTAGGTSYSWPVGSVNIDPRDHWSREIIVHETSHQIMWQESQISSFTIGVEYLFRDGKMVHYVNLLYTRFQALTEGWAEFLEAIFSAPFIGPPGAASGDAISSHDTPPYSISQVDDVKEQFKKTHTVLAKDVISFAPPYDGCGEMVEGAFANSLWELFHQFIASGVADAHVLEAQNDYEVVTANPWVKQPDVQARFNTTVWAALGNLRNVAKTTTNFIDKIRTDNPALWSQLAAYFQSFNIFLPAVQPGTIPTSGPSLGSTVTIKGDNFVNGMEMTVGGQAATVVVNSAQDLTCFIPGASAPVPAGAKVTVDLVIQYPVTPLYNSPGSTVVQKVDVSGMPRKYIYQG